MEPAIPQPLCAYISLFNRGEFFESHEVLEHAWLENGSDFYHGLIIYAAAFVKRDRGNPRGITLNFRKALPYLRSFAPSYLGIDVTRLIQHAEEGLQAIQSYQDIKGDGALNDSLQDLVPCIRLNADPALVRGDERELSTREE